jgi:restriction system protein
LWTDLQRERANRQRLEQQARRAAQRAEVKAARDRDQARRAAVRQAAASERERKRLYIEDRKSEAAAMVADLQTRLAELDSVLTAGIRQGHGLTFASLKRAVEMPAFDPERLDQPIAEPQWSQFAPRPPGPVGRMFGGGARYAREQAAAREAYEMESARHAAAESDRRRQLAEIRCRPGRVDFETLLSQYKFAEGMDAVAGLDSRPDLLDMTPTEFEHLVR